MISATLFGEGHRQNMQNKKPNKQPLKFQPGFRTCSSSSTETPATKPAAK